MEGRACKEDLYREIVESSTDAIVCCKGCVITCWNRGAERLFGYSKEEALGRDVEIIIPERLKKAHREAIERIRKTGRLRFSGKVLEMEAVGKDGTTIPVSLSLSARIVEGEILATAIIRDMRAVRRKEEILRAANNCLLSLGTDFGENARKITKTAGSLLNGMFARYSRLEGGFLRTIAIWNEPSGFKGHSRPEGRICYDIIRKGGREAVVIQDLPDTPYVRTDPDVKAYGLKTYIGHPVRIEGRTAGVLCVVFTDDRDPTPDDLYLLGILAGALEREEERNRTLKSLEEKIEELERMNRLMVGRELKMIELKREIKELRKRLEGNG